LLTPVAAADDWAATRYEGETGIADEGPWAEPNVKGLKKN